MKIKKLTFIALALLVPLFANAQVPCAFCAFQPATTGSFLAFLVGKYGNLMAFCAVVYLVAVSLHLINHARFSESEQKND